MGMTVIDDLARTVEVEPGKRTSGVALAADGARVVVFAFDGGVELAAHKAPGPILLQALQGHLRVTADGETADLRPGGMLHIDAGVIHSVQAAEPSKMALTLIRR